MSDPTKVATQQSDDELYVSPTSDDTPRERYLKIREREAQMSNEELLNKLRNSPLIFVENTKN